MSKLRWGVIAAGGIADRRTIPGMMKAENAELVAVMEIEKGLAERIRNKYGVKRAYDTVEGLLADPEVDAVYIASPVWAHAAQARLAADAAKHILIEKPLAMSAMEAEDVVVHCRQKNVLIAAGFVMRFGACIHAMKQAVSAGKIGHPVSVYAQFTCWYPPIANAWRQQKATAGGGALIDMGIHCIDLIMYIMQNKVCQVVAFNDNQIFDYEVEDASTLLLRLSDGTQCVVQSNFNIPDSASKWRFEIFGTGGRLLGDDVIGQDDRGTVDAIFLTDAESYNAQQDKVKTKGAFLDVEFGNNYTREIESFSDSVLHGTPLVAPAEDAVYVQRVIEAAYRSSAKKVVVDVLS